MPAQLNRMSTVLELLHDRLDRCVVEDVERAHLDAVDRGEGRKSGFVDICRDDARTILSEAFRRRTTDALSSGCDERGLSTKISHLFNRLRLALYLTR